MGKSRLCKYWCEGVINCGNYFIYGANKLRDALEEGKGTARVWNEQLKYINVFAQTAAGRQVVQKDYIRIYPDGNMEHCSMS